MRMLDTRDPERPSRTFSRCFVAPALQAWLDGGGTVEGWLHGRTPLISYARISADRLDGDSVGVTRQHRGNTRSAAALGCAVVLHYEDNNLTADRVRARTARSRADRAEEGGVYAGPRRFGWLGASTDPHRIGNKHRNDEEWPHLLSMIKARAAGGSWRGIAADLNRRGVRTAREGRWSEQGVRGLVTHPAWWGGRVLDGALVRDPATGEPVIGRWDHADEARDGVGCATWIGIMNEVRAGRARRGLALGRAAAPEAIARAPRVYLFSGVLRCGRLNDLGQICRSRLCGNRATGRNAKYGDYYRCGDPNCRGVGRRVAPVDAFLEGLVIGHLEEHATDGAPHTAAWRGEEKPAELRAARGGIESSLVSGEVAWDDVRDLLMRLGRHIESLESERREHAEEQAEEKLLRAWSPEKWARTTVHEKRAVITRILASVLVLPVPEGVSDKAPFDPALLIPEWRRETTSGRRAP